MTPIQSQLWQFIGLVHWQCAHPERLPLAPLAPAEVLIVVDTLTDKLADLINDRLICDIAMSLSLDSSLLCIMSQTQWLKAKQPKARLMLAINVSTQADTFHHHFTLSPGTPWTAAQKRALWSCLCRNYLEH